MFRFSYSKLARLSKEGRCTHKPCWLACVVSFGTFEFHSGTIAGFCRKEKKEIFNKGTLFCSQTDMPISDCI